MKPSDADELIRQSYARNAPAVDVDAAWERLKTRMAGRKQGGRSADDLPWITPADAGDGHRQSSALRLAPPRATAPRRRAGRLRLAVYACIATVLVAAIVVGSLEAAKYVGGERPVLVFTDLPVAASDAWSGTGTGARPLVERVMPVMGTAVLEHVVSEGSSDTEGGAEEGVRWVRDRAEVYRVSTSDPYTSGTMEIVYDLGTRPGGSIDVKGSWVLRTGQGIWVSSFWTGAVTADGEDQFCLGKAAGTGEFEGLMLILQWHRTTHVGGTAAGGAGSSDHIDVSGWIQSSE